MKLLQIFGFVVAVHFGVFLVIFAVPGCRSTGKQKPPAAATGPIESAPTPDPYASPITSSPSLSDNDLNPAVASDSTYSTPTYSTGGAPGRHAPTRPGTSPTPGVPTAPGGADVQPVATYTVVSGDSLWKIAKNHGTTVAELAAANNLSRDATLRLGQKLIVPAGSASSETAAIKSSAGTPYTVVSGDTLGGIARRHGVTVSALRSANNLNSDLVRVGQTLTVPTATAPAAGSPTPAATATTGASVATGGLTHTVMPGETLGGIARKYQVTVGDIATANNIADPTKLRAGQQLRIPGWDAPPPSATTTATTPSPRTPAPSRPAPQPAPLPGTTAPAPTPAPAPAPVVPAPGEDLDAGLPDPEAPPVQMIEENGALLVP